VCVSRSVFVCLSVCECVYCSPSLFLSLSVCVYQAIKELGHEQQFPVVDWFTDTCESQTQSLAPEFSNDGLHLNTAGYLKLAELVWNQVLEDLLNTHK